MPVATHFLGNDLIMYPQSKELFRQYLGSQYRRIMSFQEWLVSINYSPSAEPAPK